ncbi:N-formylglutamate amidohydrolase [Brevundimonas sp. NPDC092305]|uniref:N-formylglutamate amidohydrolase n=1 Tax=Brevundimonas sp. NPDC092305 TaxID=3363957 RepID=UPI00381753D5
MAGDETENDEATFAVVPASTPGPFVFASPHSGDLYPADMDADPDLPTASLRSAEDALVDRLIASGPDLGAPLVIGRVGRAYLDLNRGPADLDPSLIGGLDTPASARAQAGYGVIPRLSGDGRALYARRMDQAEARRRIETVHAPYHAALAERLQDARRLHGRAVLVDWHSMPSQAAGGARGVDVVLGDRHGGACDARIVRRLRTLFEFLGWRVALNQPYAGGWTTERWGRPDEGFHAIQIELSRALYFDESARVPGPGWSRCLRGVERVIADLLAAPA